MPPTEIMRACTLTMDVTLCQATPNYWASAYYRGELIADGIAEKKSDAVERAMIAAEPKMRARGFDKMNAPKVLRTGERYDKEANYPHEDY